MVTSFAICVWVLLIVRFGRSAFCGMSLFFLIFLLFICFNLDYWGFLRTSAVMTKSAGFIYALPLSGILALIYVWFIWVCCLLLCYLPARIARSFSFLGSSISAVWRINYIPMVLLVACYIGLLACAWYVVCYLLSMLVYPTSIKSNFIRFFFFFFSIGLQVLWNRRNLPRWPLSDVCYFIWQYISVLRCFWFKRYLNATLGRIPSKNLVARISMPTKRVSKSKRLWVTPSLITSSTYCSIFLFIARPYPQIICVKILVMMIPGLWQKNSVHLLLFEFL